MPDIRYLNTNRVLFQLNELMFVGGENLQQTIWSIMGTLMSRQVATLNCWDGTVDRKRFRGTRLHSVVCSECTKLFLLLMNKTAWDARVSQNRPIQIKISKVWYCFVVISPNNGNALAHSRSLHRRHVCGDLECSGAFPSGVITSKQCHTPLKSLCK